MNCSEVKTLKKASENIVGTGENTINQHSLLFQEYFRSCQKFTILDTLILLSAIPFKLVKSKMLSFGKGLIDGKSSMAKSTCQSR